MAKTEQQDGSAPYTVKERKNGQQVKVTITDKATGIGLQFIKGEQLQKYLSNILVSSEIIRGAKDLKEIVAVREALEKEAERLYPYEFGELKTSVE